MLPGQASTPSEGRLFLLGAGFSAEAGVPMTSSLLDHAMQLFRAECPGIFERVRNYTQLAFGLGESEPDYRKLSLPDLCTFLDYVELRESGGRDRWSDHGCRERLALKHYLAKAVMNSTPSPDKVPKLYKAFAGQLRETDVVVSFNWDCLLEKALTAVGKSYTYGGSDSCTLMCKMHGSVHWRIGNERAIYPKRFTWRSVEFTGVSNSGLYYSNDLFEREAWTTVKPIGGEVEPFLVLPGYGKAKDVHVLRWLWYKPEGLFAWVKPVYVIGLSLSPDDFFVRSFLLMALSDYNGPITVINPDPAARANYDFLSGHQSFSYHPEKFGMVHVEGMHPGT